MWTFGSYWHSPADKKKRTVIKNSKINVSYIDEPITLSKVDNFEDLLVWNVRS